MPVVIALLSIAIVPVPMDIAPVLLLLPLFQRLLLCRIAIALVTVATVAIAHDPFFIIVPVTTSPS